MKAAQSAAEQRSAELESAIEAAKEREEELERRLKEEEEAALQKARETKDAKLKELEKLLASHTTEAAIPPPAASASQQERTQYEANIADRAIRTLVHSNSTYKKMDNENSILNRKLSSLGAAWSGFDNAPAGLVSVPVNASASGQPADPGAKRAAVDEDVMQARRRENPTELWRSINQFYVQNVRPAVKAHGTITASRGAWEPAELDTDRDTNQPECLHAGVLHPNLMQTIGRYNTGRTISQEDTGRMIAGLNTSARR
jgi:hypothetical protein